VSSFVMALPGCAPQIRVTYLLVNAFDNLLTIHIRVDLSKKWLTVFHPKRIRVVT